MNYKFNKMKVLQMIKWNILTWLLFLIFSYFTPIQLFEQGLAKREAVVRRIANQVIQQTSFQFVDTKTGKTYTTTEGLLEGSPIRVVSWANRWAYVNGVLDIGMLQVGKLLNDDRYTNYSLHN